MSRKKTISLVLGLILGIVLIALWVRATPWAEFKEHFNNLSIKYVVLGSAVYISAYFVRAYRWKRIMDIRFKIPISRIWNYAMAGNLINYLIPIRAGELMKALFVKRNHQVGISDSLPLIIVDKTFDTLAILVVLAMLPFLKLNLSGGVVFLMVLLGLFFIFSVGILLCAAWKKELVTAFIGSILSIFPKRIKSKMVEFLERFVAGLNIFEHSTYSLILAVLLTLLGIFLDGLYFYFMFLSFGIGMSFFIVLFGYSLINLSYGLPQPPAQLGSNEWMMIVIFSLGFSLTKSAASAVMAFAHILTAIIMVVLGTIGIAMSGREIIYMVLKGDK